MGGASAVRAWERTSRLPGSAVRCAGVTRPGHGDAARWRKARPPGHGHNGAPAARESQAHRRGTAAPGP